MKKSIFALSLIVFLFPSVSFAAISFDSFSKVAAVTSGSSVSWTHTVSGSNPVLIVDASNCNSTDPNFTATYNGVSMTLVQKKQGSAAWTYLFELFNPSLGANTVTLSWTAGAICWGGTASSYDGVAAQSPTATSTNAVNSTSISDSVTPTVNNSWTIFATRAEAGGTITAGNASTTLRGTGDINESIFDSNSPASSGSSYTMQANSTVSGWWGDVMITLQPYVAPVLNSPKMSFNWITLNWKPEPIA